MFLLVLFCFSSLSLSLLTIFFSSSGFSFSYSFHLIYFPLFFPSLFLFLPYYFFFFPPSFLFFFPPWNNGLVQIGKGVCKVCILSTCLFNLNAEYIIRNARLDEPQAGIKIARRNINNLGYADDTILMAEIEEELKNSWWKWKRSMKKLT